MKKAKTGRKQAKIGKKSARQAFIDSVMKDGMTPEERLLMAVFGAKKSGVCPIPASLRTKAFAEQLWEQMKVADKVGKILKSRNKVADFLDDFNMWRRGQGKYEWHEDAGKTVKFPWPAWAVGKILDRAIVYLRMPVVVSGKKEA